MSLTHDDYVYLDALTPLVIDWIIADDRSYLPLIDGRLAAYARVLRTFKAESSLQTSELAYKCGLDFETMQGYLQLMAINGLFSRLSGTDTITALF
jgi:hypothetical protein